MKDFNVAIQFCIAHLIRDIRFLISFPDAETKVYGEKLLESVKKLFKVIHECEGMTEQAFKNGLEQAKETIMTVAMGNVPSSLDKNGKAYFEFITTPGIEPTNNVALSKV